MSKIILFRGVATALITPFKDGEIDYPSLKRIIEVQLSSGINALVIGGTTGEISTLSEAERERLYAFSIEEIRGRACVVLGTGSNDTKEAIRHTKMAKRLGADGALVVTPYYNKCTNDGLKKHYLSIAEEGNLPIILYNVPSRTGVNIPIKVLDELKECEFIVGIKEADDSAERLSEIALMGEDMPLYSGNDALTYATLSLGGFGVISVASNACPKKMLNITEEFFLGNYSLSRKHQRELLPFISALFSEVNPSPIKYAMSALGLCSEEVRLPLTPPKEGVKRELGRMININNEQ